MKNYYVTEEIFPENKTIKWTIIYITVYLLFICIFSALVNIYFTEGIMNVILFSIIVIIIGFVITNLIFNMLFPNIRKLKLSQRNQLERVRFELDEEKRKESIYRVFYSRF